MLIPLALDTSVAVPLLVQNHAAHPVITRWWNHRDVARCGHASIETYAVLTRLPGDSRLAPADAARLLREAPEGHVPAPARLSASVESPAKRATELSLISETTGGEAQRVEEISGSQLVAR